MNNITTTQHIDPKAIEAVLVKGDVSSLTSPQRLSLINNLCETIGLNPLTRPFDFMKTKDGREIIYANKGCAEQLRKIHGISLKIVDKQKMDDVYIVTAEAVGKDGRVDSSTGVVTIGNLKGDLLANALMKCETKAKRRVTFSICGLNMLDETEVETIPGAVKISGSESSSSHQPIDTPYEPLFEEDEAEVLQNDLGAYTIQIGKKFRGSRLKDCNPHELNSYSNWLRDENAKKANASFREAHEHIEAYLKSIESER